MKRGGVVVYTIVKGSIWNLPKTLTNKVLGDNRWDDRLFLHS